MENTSKDIKTLLTETENLRRQLYEANETIEAIRTGQVDALVLHNDSGHELYTLSTADRAYRMIIEKMNEGVVSVNAEGIILYANSKFARMIGQELSNVLGMPMIDFIDHNSHHLWDMLMHTRQEDCKAEVCLSANHRLIPVLVSCTMLEDTDGFSVNVIVTDLTSQKAIQKQLEDANDQLEQTNQALESRNHDLQQFASVASHDLQEPLRKIQMFSNIIHKNLTTEQIGENAVYLDKILRSAERMKNLIVDVLNYSKLSASSNQFVHTDLNQVIAGLLDDFELLIQEKQAIIRYDTLPTLQVNRGQIHQALQNLISNALKFCPVDRIPVIEITSERIAEKRFDGEPQFDGPYCLLNIKDNGIGFDQKYATQIFSLFERLNPKHQYAGTGIGLSITKKIIDNHHGLIRATSSPEHGAIFQIILPLTQS